MRFSAYLYHGELIFFCSAYCSGVSHCEIFCLSISWGIDFLLFCLLSLGSVFCKRRDLNPKTPERFAQSAALSISPLSRLAENCCKRGFILSGGIDLRALASPLHCQLIAWSYCLLPSLTAFARMPALAALAAIDRRPHASLIVPPC